MADIIEVKRRFFHGLDADKPATGANGDRYYATDKNKLYYWTGAGWKTGLGYEYVPREVAVPDYAVGDLVTDGTWKVDGLDFSGFLPVGTKGVVVDIYVVDNLAAQMFTIRQNDVAVRSRSLIRTQVANISVNAPAIIPIDADRLMDYYGQNTVFASIDLTVIGYFV